MLYWMHEVCCRNCDRDFLSTIFSLLPLYTNEAQQSLNMSFMGDKLDDMAEKAAFEAGGYTGLWQYKAWKLYETVSSGECCK